MTEELRTESNSSFSDFGGCPRKYKYKYIDLLKPIRQSESLILGITGHDALEIYYKEGLDAALEMLSCIPADDKEDALKAKKIGALLKGYHNLYKDDDFKVIEGDAIEREFHIPLHNPETGRRSPKVSLVGKIDLVAETSDGKVWLVDHKFKGQIGERDHYAINSQADLYLHALKEEGIECEGIIWNILRTPSIRVKQNETQDEYIDRLTADTLERPEFYYVRFKMKRYPDEIMETIQDIWGMHKDMLNAYRSKYFRRNPGECHKYGTCKFLPLCSHNPIGQDDFTVKEKRHSELKQEVF